MRDLNINEEFDVPTEIDREELADDIIMLGDGFPETSTQEEYEEFRNVILEAIDEHVENYTHTNGKVYVDDWDVFDSDLRYRVRRKISEHYGEEE